MIKSNSIIAGLFLHVTVFAAEGTEKRSEPVGSQSILLDLSPFHNNKGFGTYPGEASFDILGQSYPAPDLNEPYYISSDTGIKYAFPGYTGPDKPDNVICDSQTIAVPPGSYFSASFLISEDKEGESVSGNVTFTYTDNSTSAYELRSLDWYSFLTINRGEIIFPTRFTATGVNYNTSHIFERTAHLDPGKELRAITLPKTTSADDGRLHVFAISLWESNVRVDIQSIRPTQKWTDSGAQVVEVTVNNAGSDCIAGDGVTVSLSGDGLQTVQEGHLKRLCPGDQKIVKIGAESNSTNPINASVVINDGPTKRSFEFANIEFGLTEWTTDLDNLARHESPDWFNDAKYGIFIHWGPYSVTGWGNSSPYESYAEWFWWHSTHHPDSDPSDVFDYRLRTYGADWAYDDTFPAFTASRFDPRAWADLIAASGARYFVLTSKHHDGFSLFDPGSSTSNRSAVRHGPKRDLLGELFDAAQRYHPHLRRGTYFSLPEWFNPVYARYGTDNWPGHLARNPYTGAPEAYTGYDEKQPPADFLRDVMLPQMETLAYAYSTDVMWCDTGASNVTAEFAARWWNSLRESPSQQRRSEEAGGRQRRQVAINSRCGIPQAADFDTPEYAQFASAQRRKWESNRGLDPFSYGYNRATPDSAYMNASSVVSTLVDIVSKNGNLLLDIGPKADGTLVQAEVDSLLEAGRWIGRHEEALFNTTYWFVQSEAEGGQDVRFTQTDEAFYVLFLERPVLRNGTADIKAPVPALQGDEVSLLAVEGGENLVWSVTGQASETTLRIEVSEALLDEEEFCWVFKIKYA
ncbi:glycoside hydrolase family 29 protein [Daldinia bambusicola]|nr:glycoside hydrolase family 29 protein [Daldinia bambusicola]